MSKYRNRHRAVHRLAVAATLAVVSVAAFAGNAAATTSGSGTDTPGSAVTLPQAEPVFDPGFGIGVPGPGVFFPRTGSADLGAPGRGLLPGLGWGRPGLPGHPFLPRPFLR